MVSAADPLVLQAGEAVRQAFNAQRKTECTSLDPYNTSGAIQYAKRSKDSNETVFYTLEIVLGGDAVFARVAMHPRSPGSKFQLISSFPGPCEYGVQDQLAVSAHGTCLSVMHAMTTVFRASVPSS